MKFLGIVFSLSSLLLLTACGGGGSSPTTLTDANVVDLAVAGTEAAKTAADSEDVPFFKSGNSQSGFDLEAFSKQVAQNMYAQTDLSQICSNYPSGTYILDVSDSSTQSNYSATATFNNCVVSDYGVTTTIDGVLTISGSQSQLTLTANITTTENSITETFSFSGTCAFNGSTIGACTYSSTFTGIDGRSYSIANVSVSGNPSAGYTVSGSVTDPDHGSITITTNSPIIFCSNGNPLSGQITITGDGSATVTFDSCTSFTVTFNGVSNSYNWADI